VRRRLARSVTRVFIRRVRGSSDEELERMMRGLRRRIVLRAIFRAMAARLDRREAAGLDAVIAFDILDRKGRHDHWQLQIERGSPRAVRNGTADPTVALRMSTPTFLRVVTGTSKAPMLYLRGKIGISGDVLFATELAGYFRIPQLR
jgi:putative sterol carrier protein